MTVLANLDGRIRALPAAAGIAPRVLLLTGALLAGVGALALSAALPRSAVDADLALLLRFMATVKGVLGMLALGLVAWRLGRQVSPGLLAVYCFGTWGMLASAVLVWQFTRLGLAAGSFHLWALALLLAAVLDGRSVHRGAAPQQNGPGAAGRNGAGALENR